MTSERRSLNIASDGADVT